MELTAHTLGGVVVVRAGLRGWYRGRQCVPRGVPADGGGTGWEAYVPSGGEHGPYQLRRGAAV